MSAKAYDQLMQPQLQRGGQVRARVCVQGSGLWAAWPTWPGVHMCGCKVPASWGSKARVRAHVRVQGASI